MSQRIVITTIYKILVTSEQLVTIVIDLHSSTETNTGVS